MGSRRRFLSSLAAVGTSAIAAMEALAGILRPRRDAQLSVGCSSDASRSVATSTKKDDFRQPNYGKWQQVQLDMPRDEILALLGEPLYRQDLDPDSLRYFPELDSPIGDIFEYVWTYGHLNFANPAVGSHVFDFSISFRLSTQRVSRIHDPFRGRFSQDGLPTVPELLLPRDGSIWSHYPRFLDLRWLPSSGCYPIHYEIELESEQFNAKASSFYSALPLPTETSGVPHHAVCFVGKQRGRWRVRAHNMLGLSKWSDYRYFEFTI